MPRVEMVEDRRLMAIAFQEFPISHTGTGQILGISDGPDGALYFTDDVAPGSGSGDFIGRITSDGAQQYFPLSPKADALGITNGPDQALWFADFGQNLIRRITPTGSGQAFSVAESPSSIALGSDGALWFTLGGPMLSQTTSPFNEIGRITTTGSVSYYNLPTPEPVGSIYFPGSIAPGPDGALWFTEPLNDKIGRITTAGVITEFDIPIPINVPPSDPTAITAGPDGALWFTVPNANMIGRITTAGSISEFGLPADSDPSSITAGPDGALWFIALGNDELGRIRTSGAVDETPIPNASLDNPPGEIVLGTDDYLWLDLVGTALVLVNPAAATPTSSPTATPATTPGPTVDLTAVQLEQVAVGSSKTRKKESALVLHFNGALNPASAQNRAAYSVRVATSHEHQYTLGKVMPTNPPTYDAAAEAVTLVVPGNGKTPRYEALQINGAVITDASGHPVNGGLTFTVTVGRSGIVGTNR